MLLMLSLAHLFQSQLEFHYSSTCSCLNSSYLLFQRESRSICTSARPRTCRCASLRPRYLRSRQRIHCSQRCCCWSIAHNCRWVSLYAGSSTTIALQHPFRQRNTFRLEDILNFYGAGLKEQVREDGCLVLCSFKDGGSFEKVGEGG